MRTIRPFLLSLMAVLLSIGLVPAVKGQARFNPGHGERAPCIIDKKNKNGDYKYFYYFLTGKIKFVLP